MVHLHCQIRTRKQTLIRIRKPMATEKFSYCTESDSDFNPNCQLLYRNGIRIRVRTRITALKANVQIQSNALKYVGSLYPHTKLYEVGARIHRTRRLTPQGILTLLSSLMILLAAFAFSFMFLASKTISSASFVWTSLWCFNTESKSSSLACFLCLTPATPLSSTV